ncbi:hypothetical protein [Pseudonocardia humida]|uniref:Uncharacterized protein n=1 Tax=Pseudonocardia humida TaxID=2800819 RepID=A0ABT0ZVT8_9PSEU|nr:hypothetical protein [Pseudonocardia humida]MCO1654847.1 hypothetical protein [Pseudonocardia humida]
MSAGSTPGSPEPGTDHAKHERAARVYEKTRNLANGNAVAQGASGVFGGGVNLLVDAAAIPFYVDLWNDVRRVYGRGEITLHAAQEYLRPNMAFLVQDLVWDKAIGSIPIIGIPFNIAFGKALTWRLGAWFGMLAALGADTGGDAELAQSTLALVKLVFPADGGVFSWSDPDKEVFVAFIASVDGLTEDEARRRTEAALRALRGD